MFYKGIVNNYYVTINKKEIRVSYKSYEQYKNSFIEMLKILNIWISYYVEDGNLLRITEEVNNIAREFNSISFEGYNVIFYEEVDI